jgi:hypothetical protein
MVHYQINIHCYLRHYVDTRFNIVESHMENLLTDATLDHWHARIILLLKEWWSKKVIIL